MSRISDWVAAVFFGTFIFVPLAMLILMLAGMGLKDWHNDRAWRAAVEGRCADAWHEVARGDTGGAYRIEKWCPEPQQTIAKSNE